MSSKPNMTLAYALWLLAFMVVGFSIGHFTEAPCPSAIPEPPAYPQECMTGCVWEIQHDLFIEGKGPISKARFNKITARCMEACNRSYDESFGSHLDD